MEFLLWLAVVPSIIVGILIYRSDKLEREPWIEIFKSFLLGIVAVVITLIISYIFDIGGVDLVDAGVLKFGIYSFIGIALIEEFSKWICACLFLRKNKNFNYLFDGIVYAAFISLGFATVENILYTMSGGISTGLLRAFTTVPAHAFFGIISGYYLAFSKNEKVLGNKNKFRTYLFFSLCAPFLLHGFYDFCLLTSNDIFFIIYLIFVVLLYVFSIRRIKKLSSMDAPFIGIKKNFCSSCGERIKGKYCSKCGEKTLD